MEEGRIQALIRIAQLLQIRIAEIDADSAESLTEDDRKILSQWLEESEENKTLYEKLKTAGFPEDERQLNEYFEGFRVRDQTKMLARIRQVEPIQSKIRKLRPAIWWAAASIVMVLMAAAYYKLHHPSMGGPTDKTEAQAISDVLPGGEKAILTLDNGQTITLDSTGKGQLATQGRFRIVKTAAGMISYIDGAGTGDKNAGSAPIAYNTISTPRKGTYQVSLPDGSKVWLNASSSLKYPTQFSGNQRLVSLTGEAYFEIVPRQAAPFVVETRNSKIEVLGTHFDVFAYSDEPTLNTTLVEGKVRVTAGTSSKVLLPGEQSLVREDGTLAVEKADTSEVVAWKEGIFSFNDMDLRTAFRQIARWYDVEVEYTGDLGNQKVSAFIPRDIRLSLVVEAFSKAVGIHCKLDGRKLIVAP